MNQAIQTEQKTELLGVMSAVILPQLCRPRQRQSCSVVSCTCIRSNVDQQMLLLLYHSLIYPAVAYTCLCEKLGGVRTVRRHCRNGQQDHGWSSPPGPYILRKHRLGDVKMTRHLTFFTAVFVYKSINGHLYNVGYFASNLNSPYLNRYHSHLQPQSFRNLKLMESTGASVLCEIPVEFRKTNATSFPVWLAEIALIQRNFLI